MLLNTGKYMKYKRCQDKNLVIAVAMVISKSAAGKIDSKTKSLKVVESKCHICSHWLILAASLLTHTFVQTTVF